MAQREHHLQKQLLVLCREQVAEAHEFVAQDRHKATGQFTHAREAGRGIRAGFPDVQLIRVVGLPTVFVELKAPGKKISADENNHQVHWGRRLGELGHQWFWANSAEGFVRSLRAAGVELRRTAEWAAATIDAKADAPAAAKKRRPSRPVAAKPQARQMAALARARAAGVLV